MSFIPNGFVPSSAVRKRLYDEEGRLKEFRPDSRGANDPALGESNSLYATDAELFGQTAPFIKANKIKDAKRRNYVIQPGGACLYFENDRPLRDPYANGRVQYTAPDTKESFGHNSLDGSKLTDPVHRPAGSDD